MLFRKSVDQSLLNAGITIPSNIQNDLLNAIGTPLKRGERTNITIIINEQRYEALLTHVNLSQSDRDIVQIRYSASSPIGQALSGIFTKTTEYIKNHQLANENSRMVIPEKEQEYIEVYAAGSKTLEIKCFPKIEKDSMKEKFFKYVGSENDLSGYQRSYKLVFYKVFFENEKNGRLDAAEMAERFKKYYIDRKSLGKIADANVDNVIANIESSSLQQVLSVIVQNPYAAINKAGFVAMEENSGKKQFVLDPGLETELNDKDVSEILSLVDKKIKLYFSRIDKDTSMGKIKEFIERFQNEFLPSKNEPITGHPFGNYIRNESPAIFYDTGLVDRHDYLVSGSVGQGNWALVPWVCIFDKKITTSATRGVYIVYLLSRDGKRLYLTFNQGCTEIRNSHSKRETIRIMHEKAQEIVSKIDSRGFSTDFSINLGENLTDLAEMYAKGTIFYRMYEKGNVPDESILEDDLSKMMEIYREYVYGNDKKEEPVETKEGEEEVSTKGTIEAIKRYIASKGFTYEDGLVENFFLSLKSKPFVILAGTSGTGKTRLVKLFAEAVGATTQNGRYQMVSVRPDWSDSSDLFGHVDLNGKFIPGAIIDFVKKAEIDEANPYFLCLDEMNLARVEYYLSDVLSVIETRDFTSDGKISTDPLISENYYGSDMKAAGKYGTVRLPENLYIVGTVNMDETTFPFSRKVLDRANTIEFSYVDVMPKFDEIGVNGLAQNLPNSFMKAEYVQLAQCKNYAEDVNTICLNLKEINEKLQTANAHVGYRVRDEIVFYMLNNKAAGLLDDKVAFDNEIMQKILPRIQGSSSAVKEMLCELFKICAGDYEGYQTDSEAIHKKMFDYIDKKDCKYKKSAAKIADMVRRYETDGFTQYWL